MRTARSLALLVCLVASAHAGARHPAAGLGCRDVEAREEPRFAVVGAAQPLLQGLTRPPVVGGLWDPVVLPGLDDGVAAYLLVSGGPASVPMGGAGTLLCDLENLHVVRSTPGVPFALELPLRCEAVGLERCVQAIELGASGSLRLTNALDVTIGSFGTPEPSFRVLTTSLGGVSAGLGAPIACTGFAFSVGTELRVTFSSAVDLATVSPITLQLVDVATGITPPGSFSVDPVDPRTLVLRPQLQSATTYQLLVPGQNQGSPGPFVRSTAGVANQDRLLCVIVTQ